MMSVILQPLYFTEANERENLERGKQLEALCEHYGDLCKFLPELPLGGNIPAEANAVVFPQLIGAVFAHKKELNELEWPILILTSGFGTVEMWDWEIVSWLRETLKLTVFTPYSTQLARVVFLAMEAKEQMMAGARFLIFQDTPGEGKQAYIFKRFYWWEDESKKAIEKAFGVELIYRSWKELNERAAAISDEAALKLWEERTVPAKELALCTILKAVKLYIAVKETVREVGNVRGVGANCLNESFHCASTPCLAWNWLSEYDRIVCACEGDTVSLISMFVFYSALRSPLMMTNIYPFLVGMAALKHEKIDRFPDIEDPDNHALGVHCGYFGFAPQSFCTQWTLCPKVLEIVAEDALAIDCRMAKGPVTLAKLHADMKSLTIIEAELEDYVQYPGSDCRNGALLRYRNRSGHKVMESLSSHHAIILQGNVTPQLLQLAKVYGLKTEVI